MSVKLNTAVLEGTKNHEEGSWLKDYDEPLNEYITENSLRLHPSQAELIEITSKDKWAFKQASYEGMQLLANLCRLIGAKKTLDIGSYTGYSALSIALVLPEGGKVVAMEIDEKFPNMGKPAWKSAGVENKIDLRIASAVDVLRELLDKGEEGTYDFAFIDADKENYDNYYEMCLRLVRPGGIVCVDNVLWGGRVLSKKKPDRMTECILAINAKIATDDRVHISMVRIGDGTTICFKPAK